MGIFSEFQSMTKLFQEAGKMELYEKIAELFNENETLKKEVSKLKKKLELKDSMEFDGNRDWYMMLDKDGNEKDGPFCPHCWDTEECLSRLKQSTVDPSFHRCHKCNYYVKRK